METLVIVIASVLLIGLLVEAVPVGWRKAIGTVIVLVGLAFAGASIDW